jgi:concanavalin A-like lectin/glucanase superfamily protein
MHRPTLAALVLALALALPLAAAAQPVRPGEPSRGLVAWFPLDGDARDVAGQANGTVVGAVRPAEDRRGDPRGALAFGGRDYVNVGVRVEPERFTISTWARPARVDRELVIFSKWSSAPGPRDRYLELRVDAGGRVTLAIPGGRRGREQQVRSRRALAPGRWTHVAATFDGERAVLYVDGAADAEENLAGFDASQGPVFLGARPDASGRRARPGTVYEGRLDDLRVHRAALSGAEVAALAHERAPGPVPNPVPRPGNGDGDEQEAAFLVHLDRLVARYDAACVRRSARAVLEVEAQAFEALDGAERAARAERNQRISGFIRRALGELQGCRGRTDAMSLDRKRSALSGLSEALWTDLVQDLDAAPLEADDDRRDGRSARGGDVRRAGPWY